MVTPATINTPSSSSSAGAGTGGIGIGMASSSASSSAAYRLPLPNPARLRTYVFRLPLFTRLTLLIILLLYILEWLSTVPLIPLLSLVPDSVTLLSGGAYRINTYPVIHRGFVHTLVNVVALVGLLERFEAEWGTLNCLALFLGPFSSIPAVIYILLEKWVFRDNTAVLGASVWIFLLIASEAIKTYRINPFFDIAGIKIPTWTTPLALIFVTSILIPHTSFLGHLCGCAVGYLWGLGYIRFLAPPDRVLRWIEGRLNLLVRLPHYVSVDQKTYGRYGVLPSNSGGGNQNIRLASWLPSSSSGGGGGGGGGQRLGP